MSNFTSPHALPHFSNLKKERESQINSLINSLKLKDVQEDKAFERTKQRIRNAVVLTRVVLGKPQFVDHDFQEVPLTHTQMLVGGVSPNHFIHEISIPFTGDRELFSHVPEEGFSYYSSDRGVIVPYSNQIEISVDLPELNPQRATEEVSRVLRMTMEFVDKNNASVETWSFAIGQRIDTLLDKKREELINLLGSG